MSLFSLGNFSSYFQGEKVKEILFGLSVRQYVLFSKPYPDSREKNMKTKLELPHSQHLEMVFLDDWIFTISQVVL